MPEPRSIFTLCTSVWVLRVSMGNHSPLGVLYSLKIHIIKGENKKIVKLVGPPELKGDVTRTREKYSSCESRWILTRNRWDDSSERGTLHPTDPTVNSAAQDSSSSSSSSLLYLCFTFLLPLKNSPKPLKTPPHLHSFLSNLSPNP